MKTQILCHTCGYIYIFPVYPHDVPVTGSFIPCFYWLNALIFRIDNKYIIIYYNHIHPYPHDITIHHGCLCSVSIDCPHWYTLWLYKNSGRTPISCNVSINPLDSSVYVYKIDQHSCISMMYIYNDIIYNILIMQYIYIYICRCRCRLVGISHLQLGLKMLRKSIESFWETPPSQLEGARIFGVLFGGVLK